ncbi:MAG: hypothetical protein MUC39_05795 [Candidatus Omnitrophica bacterium]|jgi:putative protease|nr:hypothetical protein [Candidatus Omnitrophota bacterium]
MPLKKKVKKAVKKAVKRKVTKRKVTQRKIVKRKVAKRTVIKRKPVSAKKKTTKKPQKKENILGTVTHYFPHVRAAVIKLKAPLTTGDTIKIKGHTTDLTQRVDSMQIDRVPISTGKPGDEIGLLVSSRVRQHDVVYKV